MRIFFSLLMAVGIILSASGIALAQVYVVKDGSATFFSESPLENIDATTKNVKSILNTQTKDIGFIIPIRGFKFKKALMEEHFNENYLESDKFPNASFTGKIKEDIEWTKDGSYAATATGKMRIHGVEKEKTYSGMVTVKDGQIALVSNFPVAVAEYNISIPKLLFQNVADTVAVKMNINFEPYKK